MPIQCIIKERRKALGLTQEQIASALGVSTPAVSKWESGGSYPDMSLMPVLARLLKVDLNTLFCFNQEMTGAEMEDFCLKVRQRIQKEGFDAGEMMVMEKLREYPNNKN
ncbi:MAG: helix-turn-helix transcriptional regulator [Eubacterium sp.]